MWYSSTIDLLWRNALAVVPLVLIAAVLCRWTRCRPATRHALWLGILAWLVIGLVLPPVSFSTPHNPEVLTKNSLATDVLKKDEMQSGPNEAAANDSPFEETHEPTVWEELPESFPGPSEPRPTPPETVARIEPSQPYVLFSADDLIGPLSNLDDEHIASETDAVFGEPEDFEAAPPDANATPVAKPMASSSERGPRSLVAHWISALIIMRDAFGQLPAIPTFVWAIGLAFILAARLHRIARFRRLICTGAPAPTSAIKLVTEAAKTMNLRRIPTVIVVNQRLSPMIWCGRRVTLVLPRTLWSELDEIGRKAVVYHELAHLRRRDHWVCWFEWAVGAVYWWHPLVWWVRGRLRDEAEHCCDAWVTWLLPRGRRAYAEALLQTRRFISEPVTPVPSTSIGIMTGRAKRFARRLTMIMTERVSPNVSFTGIAVALSLVFAGWLATPAQSSEPEDRPVTASVGKADSLIVTSTGATLVASAGEAPDGPSASSRSRASRGDLEDRMDRLERQIADLAKQMKRMAEATQRRPEAPAQPQAANNLLRRMLQNPGAGSAISQQQGRVYVRTYQLPRGKLADLTELMIRSDVPTRVRAVDDGIEVHGTAMEHAAFKAFADSIRGSEQSLTVEYYLPKGKLEALKKLMIRSDVPIRVSTDEETISVHGSPADQVVFKAFLQLLHPQRERSTGTSEAHAPFDPPEALAAVELYREAAEEKRRAEEARDRATQQQEAFKEYLKSAHRRKKLEAEIEQLEDKADLLSAERDILQNQAEVLRAKAKKKTPKAKKQLLLEADDLDAHSNQIQSQVLEMRRKAKVLEIRINDLKDGAAPDEVRPDEPPGPAR